MPRAPKQCGRQGCHERTIGRPYCDAHTAEAQRRRASHLRGYDNAHKHAREHALANLRDGDPCCRCGEPMNRTDAPNLHLDHNDDRSGYLGLAHARCNARAGAQSKRRQGRATHPSPPPS